MCTAWARKRVGVSTSVTLNEGNTAMNTTTTTRTRRSLAALAAGGLLTLATALPATAVVLPDPIGTAPAAAPAPQVVVSDNGLELNQLALGALGGIALAGAGAAAIRARRHHHPQPA